MSLRLDTAQLKATLARRVPIEAAALDAVDWTDFAAEEAQFLDCQFDQVGFAGTNFTGARFTRCRFVRCRFSHAELRDAVFESCGFLARDAASEGCSFAFSSLRAARFTGCDLSLCRFDRSDLFDIEMDHSILRGARFHRVDFSHAYSRKLVATRATFRACNFELAELAEARLSGCDLTGSRLREADLTATDLTDATLRDCDLFQAALAKARLAGADLRGAEISGLNLMELASFAGLKITQGQQHGLLTALGVDVHPEPG